MINSPRSTDEALERYAASPLYRAATVDELVVRGNPYRRPVRPDDLRILDLRTPVARATPFELKALIAHRLLLNINESDFVLLPEPDADASVWDDLASYYDQERRSLGEAVRPLLEACVFGFLTDATATAAPRELMADTIEGCRRTGSPAATTIAQLEDRERAATMYLIQMACTSLVTPSVVARGLLGELGAAQEAVYGALAGDHGPLWPFSEQSLTRALLSSCGLDPRIHAYWQFYLASSMALSNYVHLTSRDRGSFFSHVGALAHWRLVQQQRASEELDMLRSIFGEAADLRLFEQRLPSAGHSAERSVYDLLVKPLIDQYGDRCAAAIALGFEQMRVLQSIADEDLSIQLAWADRRPTYQDRARRIYDVIQREGIQVDLETFIESCEETSTTHVHDSERLLVIESGVMHFWNRPGERIEFQPGDVMLVPAGRLHGSTVVSGQCTYHQPIITPDVLAAVEAKRGG